MKFFQKENFPTPIYKIMKVNQLDRFQQGQGSRSGRRPYEKYKDMNMALQLIERNMEKQSRAESTHKNKSTMVAVPPSKDFEMSYQVSKFPSKRIKVGCKSKYAFRFQNLLMRCSTVDQLRNSRL